MAVALACLSGCVANRTLSPSDAHGCEVLAEHLKDRASQFTARISVIRGAHLQMRDYDRRILDALRDRSVEIHKFLQASRDSGRDLQGCSGKPLSEMRADAAEELFRIRQYLNTFQQALKEDPADKFIDDP